jgi:hypothetical protein
MPAPARPQERMRRTKRPMPSLRPPVDFARSPGRTRVRPSCVADPSSSGREPLLVGPPTGAKPVRSRSVRTGGSASPWLLPCLLAFRHSPRSTKAAPDSGTRIAVRTASRHRNARAEPPRKSLRGRPPRFRNDLRERAATGRRGPPREGLPISASAADGQERSACRRSRSSRALGWPLMNGSR